MLDLFSQNLTFTWQMTLRTSLLFGTIIYLFRLTQDIIITVFCSRYCIMGKLILPHHPVSVSNNDSFDLLNSSTHNPTWSQNLILILILRPRTREFQSKFQWLIAVRTRGFSGHIQLLQGDEILELTSSVTPVFRFIWLSYLEGIRPTLCSKFISLQYSIISLLIIVQSPV